MADTNLYAIPYWWRAAIVLAMLMVVAGVEFARVGARATRWKEYAAWLAMSALGAAFGACNDLVTSGIAPAYFELGKGLAHHDASEFAMAVADLGARAGCSAGLLLGGIILMANTPGPGPLPLPYRRLARFAVLPFVTAAVMAPVMAGLRGWDPQGLGAELRAVLSEGEVRAFLVVQRAHLGAYLGAILGTFWATMRVRRARRELA